MPESNASGVLSDEDKNGESTGKFGEDTHKESLEKHEESAPIRFSFGEFESIEKAIPAIEKAIKDSQAKVTEVTTKYSELLESSVNNLMTTKGTEKPKAEMDWETLETDYPELVPQIKAAFSHFEDKIKALEEKGLKDLEAKVANVGYSQDANALATARKDPAFAENEADILRFIEGFPADAVMANLAIRNPKFAGLAGNKYLAGLECWRRFSDKGIEYERNARSETLEPSSGGPNSPATATAEETEILSGLGLSPELQKDVIKRIRKKAKGG